jgi:sec-independent protein translocase protein TatA
MYINYQSKSKKICIENQGRTGTMIGFSTPELLVVLGIALVVFGPGKLPEVGKAVGKSIQEFKKAMLTEEQQKQVTSNKEEQQETEKKG